MTLRRPSSTLFPYTTLFRSSQLGGERSKGAQGFVLRQLQVIGTKECAPALGRALGDADLCEYAAQALLAIRKDRRSEEHTSELQSLRHLVCRLLLEKKNSTT